MGGINTTIWNADTWNGGGTGTPDVDLVTVEALKLRAASMCGDSSREIYTDLMLTPFYASAYEEIFDWLQLMQIPSVKTTIVYTLPANTTTLTLSDIGISDFGNLVRLQERQSGTTNKLTDITAQDPIDRTATPDVALHTYLWESDVLSFVGATVDVELWITYWLAGRAADSGVVVFPNAANFLACRMAAIAGASQGLDPVLIKSLDLQARGPRPDDPLPSPGGHLGRLLTTLIRANAVSIVPKSYRMRPRRVKFPI